MICITCGITLDPRFKYAIAENKCSGCGGPIMNEAGKILLDELTQAMEKMQADPLGLAGWLLSHYHLQKYGTGEPEQFHENKKRKNSNVPENTEAFFQKAGVPSKLKDIADKIKKSTDKMYEDEGEQEVQELDAPTEEDLEIASKMVEFAPPIRKNSRQESAAFPSFPKPKVKVNQKDLEIAEMLVNDQENPALEKERLERLAIQQHKLKNGGGLFKRSS